MIRLTSSDCGWAKMSRPDRVKDGHYEIPQPFINENVAVLNNKVQAYLQRKISRNEKLRLDYIKF